MSIKQIKTPIQQLQNLKLDTPNCPVCQDVCWIDVGDDSSKYTAKTGLIALGYPLAEADNLLQKMHEISIVRDEGTNPWFCSIPCLNCNRIGTHPAPDTHYYRLVWTDHSKTIFIAISDENGNHMTRAQYDALEDEEDYSDDE